MAANVSCARGDAFQNRAFRKDLFFGMIK